MNISFANTLKNYLPDMSNISFPRMPNISLPDMSNISLPNADDFYAWVDKHSSIGQCVANATEAIDVLRCDPDLSSLPTKYDPFSLCYKSIYNMGLYQLSWHRMIRQLYSADLKEKFTEQAVVIEKLCYEQRRICTEIFNGTRESALWSFECLKPHFGNTFRFESDSSVQNLCRIAYNKFSEARGLLEIDLFTRGLSFFDKNCSQLEPLSLTRYGLPFENYTNDLDFYINNTLAVVVGLSSFFILNSKAAQLSRGKRVVALIGSGTLLAYYIHTGNWRQNHFNLDHAISMASISFIASSVFGAFYQMFRKEESIERQ